MKRPLLLLLFFLSCSCINAQQGTSNASQIKTAQLATKDIVIKNTSQSQVTIKCSLDNINWVIRVLENGERIEARVTSNNFWVKVWQPATKEYFKYQLEGGNRFVIKYKDPNELIIMYAN